jgi:hypothetical protein
MQFRAIVEVAVHMESFRNIELWYQGVYFLSATVGYLPPSPAKPLSAHPFAHTENFHPNEQSKRYYDHQIVRPSFIDEHASRFVSKSFLVKYYEEEVELNDICHFRVETPLSDPNPQFAMALSLHFVDMSQKKPLEKMDVLRGRRRTAKGRRSSGRRRWSKPTSTCSATPSTASTSLCRSSSTKTTSVW